MPRVSGIYTLPVGNPVVTGTTITSNWANTTLTDISTTLTGSVASDGQTPMTGNLQMGNNQITGLAPGVALTDAANVGQTIASGTAMLFAQTNAPVGWTKSTTHNNKALRVVSGTASSGGSVGFTTAFSSQNVGDTTLTTAQIPSHNHSYGFSGSLFGGSPGIFAGDYTGGGSTVFGYPNIGYNASATGGGLTIQNTGGGGSHTHSLNLAVQYVDVIIATKD
jgi:hypothetical protein